MDYDDFFKIPYESTGQADPKPFNLHSPDKEAVASDVETEFGFDKRDAYTPYESSIESESHRDSHKDKTPLDRFRFKRKASLSSDGDDLRDPTKFEIWSRVWIPKKRYNMRKMIDESAELEFSKPKAVPSQVRATPNNNNNMIGGAASRYMASRRRSSLASIQSTPSHVFTNQLAHVSEEVVAPVARRRAVDSSDLRTCALLQTQLKNVRHYPE
ncbi:unnamed protein product [Owenia fusiformis]|uniref:Uncharacterized protein n=1 Tax=Owenia fusiformis TaxID=6347 RepID=A0A8J1TYW8_OWEFU|nr:unnamed protein product [Owenia fusiformis]